MDDRNTGTVWLGKRKARDTCWHHLDDWGPKGGHEWPYWHHQMWEYVGAHF